MYKAYNLLEWRDHIGGARRRSRPESEENSSFVAYGGLELALGGAIGGGAQGGAAGGSLVAWKGTRRANWWAQ